jgi:cytochrome c553
MRLRRWLAAGAALLWVAPAPAQDAAAGKAKAAPCVACHGAGGSSTNGIFPSLAGQTARYLYLQLRDYKEGRRENVRMQRFVAELSPSDMQDLAAYFAAQPLADNGFQADPARVARGKAKAAETLCTMCHLGEFKGQNEVPRVAGQQHDYVVSQLRAFKNGTRTNDAGTMSSVSKTLKDEDIEDLAHYLAALY